MSEGIFTYSFPATAGAGVDVYIVDTGVRTSHADFGGRAEFLGSFGQGVAGQDKDGHGTHVAGTATGQTFGIAKNASVFAVKVLGDDGSGLTTDIISGLNLVASRVSNVSQADGGNDNASSSVVLNLPSSAVVEIPGTTITASFATATQVLTFPPIITTVTFPAISTSVSPSSTPVSLSSIDNIQSQSSTSAASSQSSISVTPVFNTVSTVAVRRAVPTASPSALPSQGNGQNTIGANAIRPSVVNMSLGGSANSRSFDAAVKSLVAQGIVVVVAAGNEGVDVGNSSPAGIAEAITVGAADVNDGVASFSNFGYVLLSFHPDNVADCLLAQKWTSSVLESAFFPAASKTIWIRRSFQVHLKPLRILLDSQPCSWGKILRSRQPKSRRKSKPWLSVALSVTSPLAPRIGWPSTVSNTNLILIPMFNDAIRSLRLCYFYTVSIIFLSR